MTTTEMTGAEEVVWDLSDLYAGGDDPRIEKDVEQTETTAAAFRERYYGRVAELSAADLREIEHAASQITVQGARYPEAIEKMTGL